MWAADPPAIGLTALQISDLTTATAAARASLTAQTNAINIKEAATNTMHVQTDALRSLGGDLVKVIKTFAELTGDPLVYDEAQVPPPAPPTPAGPPPQPTELSAALLPGGGIRLAWKGSVSQGAYFSIYRRLDGESSFTLIKSPKTKSFDDTTVPAGIGSLVYYIQAVRDEFSVDSSWFMVNLGAGGTTVTAIAMAA